MQSEVLQRLDFNVTVPSRFGYLERFVKLSHSDDLVMNFARYITELSLMQVELHKWRPSQVAASAIYVARKVLKRPEPWSALMCQQTSYDEKAVRACAKELCLVINAAQQAQEYKAIFKKFSQPRFMEVAKICQRS